MSGSALFETFARLPLAFDRGEGSWLMTVEGERYLDFAAGIAVNSLGYSHPHLVAAITEQAQKLWHVSNLYEIPGQRRLGERLVAATFADKVFFTNSGAEAIECAIKTARRYHFANGHPERYRTITFEGAFHGRTLATIAAGGQAKYLEGFGPKVEGFDQVPFGDLAAAEKLIGPETAAILIEPLQGEGGIRLAPTAMLRKLRDLCDKHGILLILDEVQCGIGRTGKLFAYQWSGIEPDIMAIAKGIGGGFPMGACLATDAAAAGMTAGVHGTTFGGNPLAMAVGNAVLDVVLADGFLDDVVRKALLMKQGLASVADEFPDVIEEIRGEGLMLGIKCRIPNAKVNGALRMQRLLTVPAGDNVLRLLPPLTVTDEEIRIGLERIRAGVEKSRCNVGRGLRFAIVTKPRHFTDLSTVSAAQLRAILDDATARKDKLKSGEKSRPFDGKVLAMIFDKPSTRTRVSFDVAMRQLGGETIMLTGTEMQLGRSETIADTAKVLSRYVDAIMIRTTTHNRLIELTENATVPVINGLTDDTHPCQLMADVMTFEEHRGAVAGKTFAWTGDGNNVLHSLVEASARFQFNLRVAVPEGSEPAEKYVGWANKNGGRIEFTTTAEAAVRDADCVVTDTWVSMGQEHRARGHNVFMPYQVNAALMKHAKPDALFMHCLPAHRGEEVTDEVIDGPNSVVYDEAENRLHAQKAVLAWCLGA